MMLGRMIFAALFAIGLHADGKSIIDTTRTGNEIESIIDDSTQNRSNEERTNDISKLFRDAPTHYNIPFKNRIDNEAPEVVLVKRDLTLKELQKIDNSTSETKRTSVVDVSPEFAIKQQCMAKFNLEERSDGDEKYVKSLKKEVEKLQDLVQVLRDQQYILSILNDVGSKSAGTPDQSMEHSLIKHMKKINENPNNHFRDNEAENEERRELAALKNEVNTLKQMFKSSLKAMEKNKVAGIAPEEKKLENELHTQKEQIVLLKTMLEKLTNRAKPTNETTRATARLASNDKAPKVSDMLKQLNSIESQLTKMLNENQVDSEIVGMPQFMFRGKVANSKNNTYTPQSRSSQSDNIDSLLNLLDGESKTADSLEDSDVDSVQLEKLLKSLSKSKTDSLEISDDSDVQKRILNLELQLNQHKHKAKKDDIEEHLMNLEKHIKKSKEQQSKSFDDDEDETKEELHKIQVALKKLNKKPKVQSKSNDDDEVMTELKSLQKAIRGMQPKEDDFDSPQDKNSDMQIMLNKLATQQGHGSGHRPKLSPAQVQALRKKLMSGHHGHRGHHHGLHGNGYDDDDDALDHQHFSDVYAYGLNDDDDSSEFDDFGYGGHHGQFGGGHGGSVGGGYGYHQRGGPGVKGFGYGGNNKFGANRGYSAQNFYDSQFGNGNYGPSNIGYNQNNGPLYPNPAYIGNNNDYGVSKAYASQFSTGKSTQASANYNNDYNKQNDNFFQSANYKSEPGPNSKAYQNNYAETGSTGNDNSQQSYANPSTGNADYSHQTVADLKNQIYDLQNVINGFNKPEYLQKPEDKSTVYNLDKQINDLKSVINQITDDYPGGQDPSKSYQEQKPDGNGNGVSQNNGDGKGYDAAPRSRHAGKSSRRRPRQADDNDVQTVFETITSLFSDAFQTDSQDKKDHEAKMDPTPAAFQDVNDRLRKLRKQLDHQLVNKKRQGSHHSHHNYLDYGYNEQKEEGKALEKFEKFEKDKKSEIFDKVFGKILDKIIKKVIPKLLETLFGKFDIEHFMDEDYKYDYDYGGGDGDSLQKTFRGFGMSGYIPLIILQLLTKVQYFMHYLQKFKFFKTFLIPALILLLVSGSIIFLVWWLQPNEVEHKQIDYSGPYDNGGHYYNGHSGYDNYDEGDNYDYNYRQHTYSEPYNYNYYKSNKYRDKGNL